MNDDSYESEKSSRLDPASLIDGILKRAGKVAGGTLDIAVDMATMSAMSGESWVRDLLVTSASPERLEAMAEAGHFLRDARETAGLSIQDLADSLDLSDNAVLEDVERGEALMPLELMLRAASLLARHDPVPFFIRFLRSYNPKLEAALEQWGVMALPRNFERERRFINLYRQHDFLRDLSDDEYQRFIEYMDASTRLVVDVMEREGAAQAASKQKTRAPKRAKTKATKTRAAAKTKAGAKTNAKTRAKASTIKPRKSATTRATASSGNQSSTPAAKKSALPTAASTSPSPKPVVRKVKPRNSAH